ncbi:MAG: glycosyltransferase family 39 protein [Candidatus Eisenbacteria sp.]|nr:glycosyltransferase family 39 protein [Candidatus Eisenbacteria bacterium]
MSTRTALLVTITAGATLLRLPGLFHALWYDEFLTVGAAQSFQDLPTKVLEHYHAPLFLVLLNLAMKITSSEPIWRTIPLVAGALSIPAIYFVGSTLANRRVGLGASALLAISIFHIEQSTELRPYSFLVLFSILSVGFFWRALRTGRWRDWILLSFFSAGALYTHYVSLFLTLSLVLVFLIFLWVGFPREGATAGLHRPRVIHLVVAAGCMVLMYVPGLPSVWALAAHYFKTGVVGFAPTMNVGRPLDLEFLNKLAFEFSGRSLHALVLCVFMFGVGFVSWLLDRDRRAILVGVTFAVPFAVLLVMRPERFLAPRYLIYLLPLFLVTVAHGVLVSWSRLWSRFSAKQPTGGAVAVVVSIFAVLTVAPGTQLRAYAQAEDWEDVVSFVGEVSLPREAIYVHPGFKSPAMLRRYMDDELMKRTRLRGKLPYRNPNALFLGGADKAWVICRQPNLTRKVGLAVSTARAESCRVFHMVNARVTVCRFTTKELAAELAERSRGKR